MGGLWGLIECFSSNMTYGTPVNWGNVITSQLSMQFWTSTGVRKKRVTVGLGHYSDVIMGAMASQITSLTIVYSTVYSGADQRKHQSSASLAFVWGIHQWPLNSPHKGPVTRKMFPFDDVIMGWTSRGCGWGLGTSTNLYRKRPLELSPATSTPAWQD